MPNQLPALAFILALASHATPARADDIDVAAFEYVDVVETVDGSVLKGVVTEQTPNLTYKLATADGSLHVLRAAIVVRLTKQRNPNYRQPTALAHPPSLSARSTDVAMLPIGDRFDADSISTTAPAPRSAPGLRIEPEIAFAIPRGDLVNLGMTTISYRTSFSPGARIGYETSIQNVALSVGGMARYTSWRLPIELEGFGSHWTLETQIYGRAALTLGRALPYAGVSLGVDTNHSVSNASRVSVTAMGFGMNLQAGVTILATPMAALELGVDFHPGTDTIEEGIDASISYLAFRLGASLRL